MKEGKEGYVINLKVPYEEKDVANLHEEKLCKILDENEVEIEEAKKKEKFYLSNLVLSSCTKDKPYNLAKESFQVLAVASSKLFINGNLSYASAGEVVFDALYLGNQEPLDVIKDDTQLHFSLCHQAGQIVEFQEAYIKKK